MADDLTALQRLKTYLAQDDAPGGTWRVDLAPGVPCAITIESMPTTIPKNRRVTFVLRKSDVFDLFVAKLNAITAKPVRIDPALITGELIQWDITLRDG